MGANINCSLKMSRKQMRLCQALKLVPIYPVTPQAFDGLDEDYDSGIERTSPATISLENHSMAEEVSARIANATNALTALEESRNLAPTIRASEPLAKKIKEEIIGATEVPNKLQEFNIKIEKVAEEDTETPRESTESDNYHDMNSEEFEYEEEIETSSYAESQSHSGVETMFLSCGARHHGCETVSIVQNPNTNLNELRLKNLELWEQEKLAAIFQIEEKLHKLISIKGKAKRLKQSKRKLLKLKFKQEQIMQLVKEQKLVVNSKADECKSKHNDGIKTEIEDNDYELEEISSPASPATSLSATSAQDIASPTTTTTTGTAMTPYNQFHKFQLSASSTPLKRPGITMNNCKTIDFTTMPCDKYDLLTIGPNGTKVAKAALQNINWSLSGAAVTRKILMEVFDRDTLAFHTLTGKPSPAFLDCDKPMKGQLDPLKVADIIHIVTQNLHLTEKEVRQAITTKCADENKMFRQRQRKRLSLEQEE